MNIANHTIELHCNRNEIQDIAQIMVHSLIFFRTYGKFNYSQGSSFSIGSLGYEIINCDHLSFSYVRCTSQSLVQRVNSKIREFFDRITEFTQLATLTLEFYKQRSSSWPFNSSRMNWELWNIRFVIKSPSPNLAIEDELREKLFDIIRIVNSEKSQMPPMPMQAKIETIFDISHDELQPYLNDISYKISENLIGADSCNVGSSTNPDAGSRLDTSRHSSFKKFLLGTLEL